MPDIRETVISDVVTAMSPLMDTVRLNMLEGAVRGALRGVKLERECTELSTDLDGTIHMLECFAACKKLEGCTDSTLDQYLRTAKRLFSMIGKGYQEITKDDVRHYLAIRTPQVSPNTLVNERRNLSSFFGWLHDEGHIPRNPVKTIKVRGEDVEVIKREGKS